MTAERLPHEGSWNGLEHKKKTGALTGSAVTTETVGKPFQLPPFETGHIVERDGNPMQVCGVVVRIY